jgi:hypothetical protein
MKAHFIDLNIVLKTESKAWIVDKSKPNIALLKLDPSDLELFKSGIYKTQGNKISFNGNSFWLPTSFMNKIEIKCKKVGANVANLGISFQEFLNTDLIENIPVEFDLSVFNNIINTNDDIYIFCSKNTKENFKSKIEKLKEKLADLGLQIKDFYYLSETYFNQDHDFIAYIKNKILIQHLVGYKCKDNTFTSDQITNYDEITYYDDDLASVTLSKNINDVLEKLLINSEETTKKLCREKLQTEDNILKIKYYTHNKANKFIESVVYLKLSNLIKTFENFNFFSSSLPR